MAAIKAPANLPELVKAAFSRAKAASDLTYFPTQVTVVPVQNSIPFQLRFSPALASKPSGPRPKQDPSTQNPKPFDPFESPEKGPLFVAELPPSHNLVLNKFAVVPEHFILATKEFKEQEHLLEADDLAATYACIDAYDSYYRQQHADSSEAASAEGDVDGELFAFFNSGPHSGASQPHRHIQLLPIRRMKLDLPDSPPWSVLANRLIGEHAVKAPFSTFAQEIRPGMSPGELHEAYVRLYRQAVAAMATSDGQGGGAPSSQGLDGPESSSISYNLAMTSRVLVICPRTAEGATLHSSGELIGKLGLNGTVLAGTALVRSHREWDSLRESPSGDEDESVTTLPDVLSSIGVATGSLHDPARL